MTTGDRVLLRALGGQPLLRWFVGCNDRVAYVTDDPAKCERVIGFPWDDVFCYRMGLDDGAIVNWDDEVLARQL